MPWTITKRKRLYTAAMVFVQINLDIKPIALAYKSEFGLTIQKLFSVCYLF